MRNHAVFEHSVLLFKFTDCQSSLLSFSGAINARITNAHGFNLCGAIPSIILDYDDNEISWNDTNASSLLIDDRESMVICGRKELFNICDGVDSV